MMTEEYLTLNQVSVALSFTALKISLLVLNFTFYIFYKGVTICLHHSQVLRRNSFVTIIHEKLCKNMHLTPSSE